ncbi:MAG: hypothetical protein J7L20_05360 [Thermoplasmata archaeon]|nr:hypothetical protein [Thermoplasmata archaeon]
MRVVGLITSMQEAKELEYIANVCEVIKRIRYLARIAKLRELLRNR